jgi:hypothetical protein
MKLEKLKSGMTVYDVGRNKMGNTTISTVVVWHVQILDVNFSERSVVASWNSNPERKYRESAWSKWRIKKPQLIRMALGNQRVARRGELTPN